MQYLRGMVSEDTTLPAEPADSSASPTCGPLGAPHNLSGGSAEAPAAEAPSCQDASATDALHDAPHDAPASEAPDEEPVESPHAGVREMAVGSFEATPAGNVVASHTNSHAEAASPDTHESYAPDEAFQVLSPLTDHDQDAWNEPATQDAPEGGPAPGLAAEVYAPDESAPDNLTAESPCAEGLPPEMGHTDALPKAAAGPEDSQAAADSLNGEEIPSGTPETRRAILGLKFRDFGQLYFFDANGHAVSEGEHVVVTTEQGLSLGQVVMAVPSRDDIPADYAKDIGDNALKPIDRVADASDMDRHAQNLERSQEAWHVCRQLVREHKLDMKLVDVEVLHDQSKMLFYFTAPNRIDFRELVKDLVKEFHTRIELRQIGVRHETQMTGAIGNCGLVCCCRQFLRKFAPVTIKMAKEQNLFLNPTKISGMCGRLLCCLSYEQENYEKFHKQCPKIGKKYLTTLGPLKVLRANFFRNSLSVLPDGDEEQEVTLDEWETMEPRRPDPNQQQQQPKAQANRKGERAKPDHDDAPRARSERPRPDKPRKERLRAERRQQEQEPALRQQHPHAEAPSSQEAAEPVNEGNSPRGVFGLRLETPAESPGEARQDGGGQSAAPDSPAPDGTAKKASRNRRRKRKPRGKKPQGAAGGGGSGGGGPSSNSA